MAQMPAVGDLVAGKYRIERALSSGGMGSVYVASHLQTGRQFALKVMSSLLAGDEEAEARFWREAKLATAIDHPAIIEVYDVGRDGAFPFMVMKLLHGESLGERLKRGALPAAEAVDLMLRVADGVAAAHTRGVVHRDLKPDNIFLCVGPDRRDVELKVLDFGISKLMTKEAQTRVLTQTGIALGTPLYMSAEQVRGAAEVDHRTDVYALGVILYEMLTGKVPYMGNTYPDLVLKIITGDTQPPHAITPSIPEGLSRVVMKAMALERDQRFQSVAEFSTALERLGYMRAHAVPRVSSVSPPGSLTPFATERASDPDELPSIVPKQQVGRWIGLGAAALALLGAGLWALGGGSQRDADTNLAVPAPAAAPATATASGAPLAPELTPLDAPPPAPVVAPAPRALPSGQAAPSPKPSVEPGDDAEPSHDAPHKKHAAKAKAAAPSEAPHATEPAPAQPVLKVSTSSKEPKKAKPAAPQPRSDLIDPF